MSAQKVNLLSRLLENALKELRNKLICERSDSIEAKIIDIKKLMVGVINYDCNGVLTDFKEKSIVY